MICSLSFIKAAKIFLAAFHLFGFFFVIMWLMFTKLKYQVALWICFLLVGCQWPSPKSYYAVVYEQRTNNLGIFTEFHFKNQDDLDQFIELMPLYAFRPRQGENIVHRDYRRSKVSNSNLKRLTLNRVPDADNLPKGYIIRVCMPEAGTKDGCMDFPRE